MLRLEWDVLDAHQIDLQWVELLAVEVGEKSLFALDAEVQVMELHGLKSVKAPSDLYREETVRKVKKL